MGDRGNIVIRQKPNTNTDDVWLYTHWSGSEIEDTARAALKRNARWDDPSYLTRIVFQELIGTDTSEIGYGISTSLQDNQHPILVIDCPEQEVYTVDESQLEKGRLPISPKKTGTQSFTDFVNQDD